VTLNSTEKYHVIRKFFFSPDLDEIYVGRGRRDVLGSMTFKVIKGQGQGHRTFKV